MRGTTLTDGPPRQHALVLDTEDELVSCLTEWASLGYCDLEGQGGGKDGDGDPEA